MSNLAILKWDDPSAGSNDKIVYKHEIEDFGYGTQVIVHENQTAVFFNNGKALGHLEAGVTTLRDLEKTSVGGKLFNALKNLVTGNKEAFHSEVYFINHIRETDVDWGFSDTQEANVVFDDENLTIQFTACGTFGFHIDDGINATKFLSYLVGTRSNFSREDVYDTIIGEFLQEVKVQLVREMQGKDATDVMNIGAQYKELANAILNNLIPVFEERYGIILDLVAFEKIKLSTETLNLIKGLQQDIVKAKREAKMKRILERTAAEDEAYRRQVGGYTYQQEAQRDVLKAAAQNEGGAGAFMNAGMGLGMGMGLGGAFGVGMAGTAQGMMNGIAQQATKPCPHCGAQLPVEAKFCGMCGKSTAPEGTTCPHCGAQLPAGAKFCGMCGKSTAPQGPTCPHCGAPMAEGAKFCGQCGKSTSVTCPQCGAELPAGAKFCGQCGKQI